MKKTNQLGRKIKLVTTISIVLLLLVSPNVLAATDITQLVTDDNTFKLYNSPTIFVQSFTPTQNMLEEVMLYLNRTASVSGHIDLRIQTARTGGTVLTTDSNLVATLYSSSGPFPCLFDVPDVSLTPGTEYWISVNLTDNLGSDYVTWFASSSNSGEPGVGDCWTYDGFNWHEQTGNDFAFFTTGYTDSNIDPTACFTHSESNLVVDVDAGCSTDSDGTITTYQWDWTNDGSYDDTGETETHTYSSGGTYTIKLRVIDNDGGSDTKTHSVTVSAGGGNVAPTAAFTTSASGLTVNVDGSGSSDSDGTITSYQWDWTNDGSYDTTSASDSASHTYSSADTYTIKLRVVDNGSATDTVTHQVTVSTGGGSSGFTADNTMWYLIAGVVAAVIIGVVVYLGPVKKKRRR